MGGVVEGIYLVEIAGEPLRAVNQAQAKAGRGIEGDRYEKGVGFYSANPTTSGARELTLIASEAIEAVQKEIGELLDHGAFRRNLVTKSIDPRSLLGKRFTIGQVVCEGVRDCPPCVHLDELTGKRLMPWLLKTGGMRVRIVEGGTIQVGDAIEVTGDSTGETQWEAYS